MPEMFALELAFVELRLLKVSVMENGLKDIEVSSCSNNQRSWIAELSCITVFISHFLGKVPERFNKCWKYSSVK